MNIYIPSDLKINIKKKLLFVLVRPFLSNKKWTNHANDFKKWNLSHEKIKLVTEINNAEVLIIPFSINYYFNNSLTRYLNHYSHICEKHQLKGYGFIAGDFGIKYPEYNHIIYFRMGGFKSQLSNKNRGFPATLSDQNKKLFQIDEIITRNKKSKPVIGFCGHATNDKVTYLNQILNFSKENIKRFFQKPFRNDYEPLFQSAYERYKLLNQIKENKNIEPNFIYRDQYRAGAKKQSELKKTTLEYYENIQQSDYIICMRGTGNFSIRFYETLMMGRIPIFINTDCLLPFPNSIDWLKHIIIVEWTEINRLTDIVIEFHNKISNESFISIQKQNRELWKTKLNPKWVLENLYKF